MTDVFGNMAPYSDKTCPKHPLGKSCKVSEGSEENFVPWISHDSKHEDVNWEYAIPVQDVKIGDYVKVTGNYSDHEFSVGRIGKITKGPEFFGKWQLDGHESGWVHVDGRESTKLDVGPLISLDLNVGDKVQCVGWTDGNDRIFVGEIYTITDEHRKGVEYCDLYATRPGGLALVSYRKRSQLFTVISRADKTQYGHVKLEDGTVWDMSADRQYSYYMLTEEQKTVFKNHGGPYQIWNKHTWLKSYPNWVSSSVYRVAPKTRIEKIQKAMWSDGKGKIIATQWGSATIPVTVTYNTIDGKIDLSTHKVALREV